MQRDNGGYMTPQEWHDEISSAIKKTNENFTDDEVEHICNALKSASVNATKVNPNAA